MVHVVQNGSFGTQICTAEFWDTSKTYLQGAYGQYDLHICPCKDIPDMGHTVDMPTGMHQWKTYHRNVLSCEIHDNC